MKWERKKNNFMQVESWCGFVCKCSLIVQCLCCFRCFDYVHKWQCSRVIIMVLFFKESTFLCTLQLQSQWNAVCMSPDLTNIQCMIESIITWVMIDWKDLPSDVELNIVKVVNVCEKEWLASWRSKGLKSREQERACSRLFGNQF